MMERSLPKVATRCKWVLIPLTLLLSLLLISAVQAQETQRRYRVAIAHPANPVADMREGGNGNFWVLLRDLKKAGYVEGQNLLVQRYSGEGQSHRFAELAREVIQAKPDVIVAFSRRLVQHFKEPATNIPVVALTIDPVGYGVAASLSRPGGNITGFTTDAGLDFYTKHFQLLSELSPRASKVAWLAPEETWASRYGTLMQEAARQAGVTLLGPSLVSPIRESEYRRVFAAIDAEGPDAIIVGDVTDNHTHAKLIVELVATLRLPAIYPDRIYAIHGGVMAYDVSREDIYSGLAAYVDRILRGEKPGELPFQQPSKISLIINNRAAKALGIEVPASLLVGADQVIE